MFSTLSSFLVLYMSSLARQTKQPLDKQVPVHRHRDGSTVHSRTLHGHNTCFARRRPHSSRHPQGLRWCPATKSPLVPSALPPHFDPSVHPSHFTLPFIPTSLSSLSSPLHPPPSLLPYLHPPSSHFPLLIWIVLFFFYGVHFTLHTSLRNSCHA